MSVARTLVLQRSQREYLRGVQWQTDYLRLLVRVFDLRDSVFDYALADQRQQAPRGYDSRYIPFEFLTVWRAFVVEYRRGAGRCFGGCGGFLLRPPYQYAVGNFLVRI
jgi:hypothetical protein